MRVGGIALALSLVALSVVPAPAAADDPKFPYGKRDELAKLPDWAASITAGFASATGNSQNLNLTGAANVTRRLDQNLVTLDLATAVARSKIPIAEVDSSNQATLGSVTQTTSEAWSAKLRYDRFIDWNAIYALGSAAGDRPSGKQFVGGAAAGYSRALWKAGKDELLVEAGVDYSHVLFVIGTPDTVDVASVRGYLGYVGNPNDNLSYGVNLEWLGNLNSENRSTGTVAVMADNRITGKLGLTWKIFGNGSLGFRFRALYNTAPAPVPLPALPAGAHWPPNYQPLAEKLDTLTEVVLVFKLI